MNFLLLFFHLIPLLKHWCKCITPITFLIFLFISLSRATKSEVIFLAFIFSIAERAVAESEIHDGFLLHTVKIVFLYKLFECLRKSPSVIIFIFPFFYLQQTKHNPFFDISFVAASIFFFEEIKGISLPFAMISFTKIRDVANVPDG